jgi:hypothetical protein
VEGFEYKVLKGCNSTLSNNPAILLEIHGPALPRYGNTFEDLWKFVNPDIYDIFVQPSLDEPVPYSPREFYGSYIRLFFKPRPGVPALGRRQPDKPH